MKPEDIIKKEKTSWHRLLARLLELLLSPLKIEVHPDLSVMTNPPEVDILLLRRQSPNWTDAQRAFLPDGIRDSKASDILIEFKYTESFNKKALQQALGYDFFYKQAKKLADKEVQTVILSAQTPQARTLERFGYSKTEQAGVYRSNNEVCDGILLLSVNDLSKEPHNVWIKCFASKKKVKEQAVQQLKSLDMISITEEVTWLIGGLKKIWSILSKGGSKMKMTFTPEEVTEFGRDLGDVWLARLNPSERLAGLTPQERVAGLKPSERVAGLKPSEMLASLKPAEIEDYLKQLKKQAH
ncbi:MAG: hypothetical protein DRR16_09100 [Candidatus Parabeggiatoa sp. nov. 3]|nr:MAG: hypothetical protein DRR00_14995 [Gammaproteobacteria bacterium]RKZ65938.1 MAG: hypothetical protein DRQ99_11200 [Gammaproteobacteria bacterium]RKZ86670.1 MAG: hypothetical protein DRR16_09100 [Gammaproteobacteria bacterium]HEW98635.1 hypothetical protein [Beggiatoa sp.]